MSWLFMVIPELYNDVGNDMFYYFTLTNQLCHILYSRLQNRILLNKALLFYL